LKYVTEKIHFCLVADVNTTLLVLVLFSKMWMWCEIYCFIERCCLTFCTAAGEQSSHQDTFSRLSLF